MFIQINKEIVYPAITVTCLSALSLLSHREFFKITGTTILTGVFYGIINDMIACRDCIEYFTLGHMYDKQNLRNRPIKTLNPDLNAIVWGMIATWPATTIAGVLFATLSRIPIPKSSIKITSRQLTPYLLTSSCLILSISHIYSRTAQKEMERNPFNKYDHVPIKFQSKWEACNIRNQTGYLLLGIGSIILSVTIVAARFKLFKTCHFPLRLPRS